MMKHKAQGRPIALAIFAMLFILGTESAGIAQRSAPMIPSGHIYLRNDSPYELNFYLSIAGSWKKYFLSPRGDIDLTYENVVLAIATTSEVDIEAPPIPAATRVGESAVEIAEPYVLRSISDKWRWELCWSTRLDKWVVQNLSESLCAQ